MLLINQQGELDEELVHLFKARTSEGRIAITVGICILATSLVVSVFGVTAVAAAVPQKTQELKGQVVNEKNLPIAGVICTVMGGMLPSQGTSVTTDPKGNFSIRGLLPGNYTLTCTALGYEPFVLTGIEVVEDKASEVQVTMPTAKVVVQKVQVQASAGTAVQQQTSQPSKLNSQELATLPIAEQKFKAALPLVPGVIRTPDGKINIRGSVENQGMLLIDSAEAVNPITGGYDIDLSVDAIQSLNVYKAPFDAQYGGFSGGLTTIETKAPNTEWNWDLNDFFPGFRGRSGHLVGINDWDPRLAFTGPLWKNLTFSESLIYGMRKIPVRGLAWPNNETKKEGYNSFTEFQLVISPQHIASVGVHLFPEKQAFANINSLAPQPASSNLAQRGYSVQGNDNYLFNSGGILTSLFSFTKFDGNAHSQGLDNMLVTPDGLDGNYFNDWSRASNQEEAGAIYRFPSHKWMGAHELSVGGDAIYRSYSGTSRSRPVNLLRADGTIAEQINFLGPGGVPAASAPAQLSSDNAEGAAFIGDHWMMNRHAAVDLGFRYFGQSIGKAASFAPRLGFVYTPGSSGNTIVRAGVGIFESRVPLLASDFASNPTRVVTLFDTGGNPIGPSVAFQNVCAIKVRQGLRLVPACSDLDATPYNLTWTAEFDHQIQTHLAFRVSYLRSSTYRDFVIGPEAPSPGSASLILSNRGAARYHEIESTVSYRADNGTEFTASYIHSRTRGDLNSLSNIYVPFEQPVIRPNLYSNLASDVPDRLITWGVFNLPHEITFAPVIDWHTGFPYSKIDVLQNYVGLPNESRFPTLFSFDFQVWKWLPLPGFLPFGMGHLKLRWGIAIRNVTNNDNPRDVYNNIASSNFNHFVGFQHRVIELNVDTGE